ncbi:hypothetical protein BH24CHL9_BH24CHL9_02170 [soil metagenome]
MRRRTDAERLRHFLRELGRSARRPATVYLVGGATAVLVGWRSTTIDIDLRLEPDHDELLRALPELKERLRVNIELASPLDFLPEPPGWRDRSPFVAQEGPLTIRHLDHTTQALAKLERGLVDAATLRSALTAIEPELYRFPSVDGAALRAAVERLVGG